EELGNELGDPRRAEQSITRALSEVFDGPLVRQLLARRAKIRREATGDRAGAAADLKKLHDLSPTDQAVLDDLAGLLRELGDYRSMVQLYEDQILRGKDMTTRAELARRVARMWEEQIQDAREAADAWRRVLRMRPGDEEATPGLERAKTNNMKKADPNAGPEQYAPPKLSLPPPPPAPSTSVAIKNATPSQRAVPPPATSSAPSLASLVGRKDRDSKPSPVLPPKSAPKARDEAAQSFATTIEASASAPLPALDDDEDEEVDSALDALEIRPEPKASSPKPLADESTAPHALSVELINTIRGASSAPKPADTKPADLPKAAESRPSQAKGPAPTPTRRGFAPSSPPPDDLARSSPFPLHAATDEELHTAPSGVPAFKAAHEAMRADTDENASAALAATTAGEAVSLDDEPEPTIMGTTLGSEKPPAYEFSDATEVHHADIPLDLGSEPLMVDDIAELVDDDDVDVEEEEEEASAKPRTVPPPLPRS
ncbi:MAG: hypothetical protein ABI551_10595, partial [Polyangiaceae bacterium]